jgi:hypothetical protein
MTFVPITQNYLKIDFILTHTTQVAGAKPKGMDWL